MGIWDIISKLLMNPFLYLFFIINIIIGYTRVKNERKHFSIRIYDVVHELRTSWWSGILLGLCFSVITVGIGLVLPLGLIIAIGTATTLLTVLFRIRWLSPAYVVGITALVYLLLAGKETGISFLDSLLVTEGPPNVSAIVWLLFVLLMCEGILLFRSAPTMTTPSISTSKRGKCVGEHIAKRLWLVPLVLLIPGENISAIFSWWPVFDFGQGSYSLIIVPFSIGFVQRIRGMFPQDSIRLTARRVFLLCLIVAGCGLAGHWITLFSLLGLAIAVIGREMIYFAQRSFDEAQPAYFSQREKGLLILGIIPGSDAEKMALKVGDMITKVNGIPLHTEKEFYEVIQQNRAFCKLEIVDMNGEPRLAQTARYEDGHYELGMIFVQENSDWNSEAI